MRAFLVSCVAFAVGACQAEQPLDCTKVDFPTVERCFEQNRDKGEATMSVVCLPFSKPLVTSGLWVVGFEKNDFFEGWSANLPPTDVMLKKSAGADLIVDERMLKKVAPDIGPKTYALHVNIVGRRSLCPTGALNPSSIAVEKLTVNRRIVVH